MTKNQLNLNILAEAGITKDDIEYLIHLTYINKEFTLSNKLKDLLSSDQSVAINQLDLPLIFKD